MGLLLSPEVKLRPDGGRSILFTANPGDSPQDVFKFLYPQQAVILSLFDGKRDLTAVREAVAYLFDLDMEAASQQVDALLAVRVNDEQTIETLIIEASGINPGQARIYDPKTFIVPEERIDMDDTRCTMPYTLLVLPTMRCVTNCRYCYADREGFRGKQELDLTLYRRLLKEARECGIETVEFSGGDFFCREDAFDFIESTLSAGMYLNIPTKYPLSRSMAQRLAATGLSTIQVSIDALNPEIIDRLMGLTGYGEKILQTLDYLGEAGIKVRTNTVLTPINIKDAVSLARYLMEKPYVLKSNFTCYGRSLYRHDDSLFCSPEDIEIFEEEFSKIKAEFPDKVNFSGNNDNPYAGEESLRKKNFWERAYCTANRRGVVVLPDGKVTICEELYNHQHFIIGDLTEQTLQEVWNSPKALELAYPEQAAVSNGPCSDCSDFRECHEGLGRCVREALKAYGLDQHYAPDPRCPRAPVGSRLA
ncbi:radical SAM additional 4Fe4S-binding SPASM domain-containing protein [Paenibacillus sophorae]|uniref:Radical SAM additional 4Fe4S-binding SPASM domain-containing protein n=1 Tax=Paenibacillus sophorae TaxID=1333845 RepID=A0A1H8SEY2_9BACL|nr:radical SAM protein [Paenibacillus sophorae]QWU16739.1 radical SAM protein [Paenibacillus sophorae]SEO77222.1 radical SAM additional 4Fe4S-binding SPASM domain-containing protein [Paenibacillus sophorae]